MKSAGWEALCRLEVTTPMQGYGDLDALKDLPVARFLVTSGFRRLQESKIRALRISPLFAAIHVDAIDEPVCRGKQAIFEGNATIYGGSALITNGRVHEEILEILHRGHDISATR